MNFPTDLLLAPAVVGTYCARQDHYIGGEVGTSGDSQDPNTHSDIMNHPGRNTRRS